MLSDNAVWKLYHTFQELAHRAKGPSEPSFQSLMLAALLVGGVFVLGRLLFNTSLPVQPSSAGRRAVMVAVAVSEAVVVGEHPPLASAAATQPP
jgi:hypothetical protein